MKKTFVSDIMTRDLFTAKPDMSLLECAKMMIRKGVGSLPIVDKNNLVGFLSQRDILWALVKNPRTKLSKIKAMDLSPKKIVTLKPETTINEAIKKMNSFKFDRFPIVKNNELLGVVTSKDILNFHPEFYPELEELSMIREEEEKLNRIKITKEGPQINDGICEECGKRGMLYGINGMLVCDDCRASI
ncbi:MAG: CBS domain-containing protein [Nanoarchaeota archaeon]